MARLKNPPGILVAHGRAKAKEKGTPGRVQYICIYVAMVSYICRYIKLINRLNVILNHSINIK
jgi:hypothetical protein